MTVAHNAEPGLGGNSFSAQRLLVLLYRLFHCRWKYCLSLLSIPEAEDEKQDKSSGMARRGAPW